MSDKRPRDDAVGETGRRTRQKQRDDSEPALHAVEGMPHQDGAAAKAPKSDPQTKPAPPPTGTGVRRKCTYVPIRPPHQVGLAWQLLYTHGIGAAPGNVTPIAVSLGQLLKQGSGHIPLYTVTMSMKVDWDFVCRAAPIAKAFRGVLVHGERSSVVAVSAALWIAWPGFYPSSLTHPCGLARDT